MRPGPRGRLSLDELHEFLVLLDDAGVTLRVAPVPGHVPEPLRLGMTDESVLLLEVGAQPRRDPPIFVSVSLTISSVRRALLITQLLRRPAVSRDFVRVLAGRWGDVDSVDVLAGVELLACTHQSLLSMVMSLFGSGCQPWVHSRPSSRSSNWHSQLSGSSGSGFSSAP